MDRSLILILFSILLAGSEISGYVTKGTTTTTVKPGDPGDLPGGGSRAAETEVLGEVKIVREEYGAKEITAMTPALSAAALKCANDLLQAGLNPGDVNVDVPSNRRVICNEDEPALQYFEFGQEGKTGDRDVARYAIRKWVDERNTWQEKYANAPQYARETRHFTQLVWNTLTSFGCAVSTDIVDNRKLFFCYFNPAGNTVHGENNVEFRKHIGKRSETWALKGNETNPSE
ncbi:unnamed protein product [Allacma fusca]|uniref:SCP domain-containing protein n=1 Tax=Allacma fusca TaxID=39272 RepID=A0A8J2P382_9HEXA|nr:unnamed protein product [Allacma fusca]